MGGEVRPASIRIEHGMIVEIGAARPEIDFGDMVVMPGLVDSHVHVNEPGGPLGGIQHRHQGRRGRGTTTIVDMPLNSIPPTVSVDALSEKGRRRRKALGRCRLLGWLHPGVGESDRPSGGRGRLWLQILPRRVRGRRVPFREPRSACRRAPVMRGLGVPSLVHAEDPARILRLTGDPTVYRSYPRPGLQTGKLRSPRSPIWPVPPGRGSTSFTCRRRSDAGSGRRPRFVGGETCPHCLTFCRGHRGGCHAVQVRPTDQGRRASGRTVGRLGRGLSMVVSDHSRRRPKSSVSTMGTSGGLGGHRSLQLRLPATWTGAVDRGIGLPQLSLWLAEEPASRRSRRSQRGDQGRDGCRPRCLGPRRRHPGQG